MAGPVGPSPVSVLALVLAVFTFGYAVWLGDRLRAVLAGCLQDRDGDNHGISAGPDAVTIVVVKGTDREVGRPGARQLWE
jgi:hypothetical protein